MWEIYRDSPSCQIWNLADILDTTHFLLAIILFQSLWTCCSNIQWISDSRSPDVYHFHGHRTSVNDQCALSFSKEKLDALFETINSFRTQCQVEGSNRPVCCIFTQCYRHLVARSAFADVPNILHYSESTICLHQQHWGSLQQVLAYLHCMNLFCLSRWPLVESISFILRII